MLQSQKCDCGEYQAKHLSCSHVMVVCKSVNVDPMNYVMSLFTLQHILHVYDNTFGLLSHKLMWQEYERDQWGPDPRRKRTQRVIRFQLTFLLRWTKTKMNGKVENNVEFGGNMTITKTIVLTCLHLTFFLTKCDCLSILLIM